MKPDWIKHGFQTALNNANPDDWRQEKKENF